MTVAFLVVSYLILGIILLFMPKRLTRQEVYITGIIVALNTLVADLYLGDILDLYDLMHKNGPQLSDLLIEISLPAAFGVLYLNYMPEEKRRFFLYLVFWVAFSVLYEQISRYFGYVQYKGWKIWYSVLFYIYACLFMRWHFLFIRKAMYRK